MAAGAPDTIIETVYEKQVHGLSFRSWTLNISVMGGADVAARFTVTARLEIGSIIRLAIWTASEPRQHTTSRSSW